MLNSDELNATFMNGWCNPVRKPWNETQHLSYTGYPGPFYWLDSLTPLYCFAKWTHHCQTFRQRRGHKWRQQSSSVNCFGFSPLDVTRSDTLVHSLYFMSCLTPAHSHFNNKEDPQLFYLNASPDGPAWLWCMGLWGFLRSVLITLADPVHIHLCQSHVVWRPLCFCALGAGLCFLLGCTLSSGEVLCAELL